MLKPIKLIRLEKEHEEENKPKFRNLHGIDGIPYKPPKKVNVKEYPRD